VATFAPGTGSLFALIPAPLNGELLGVDVAMTGAVKSQALNSVMYDQTRLQ